MCMIRHLFWLAALLAFAAAQLTLSPLSALTGTVISGQLQINLTFSSWSTDFNESYYFPASNVYLDASAGPNYWASTTGFLLNLAPPSSAYQDLCRLGTYQSGTVYSKAAVVQVHNAYESNSTCTTNCNCPYDISLAQNATAVNCHVLFGLNREFQLQVQIISGGGLTADIILTPWTYTHRLDLPMPLINNGVGATAVIRNVTGVAYLFGTNWSKYASRWCLNASPDNESDPGFLVPDSAFGDLANSLGINDTSLQTCRSSYATDDSGCSTEPYGACTQIGSGSPYDQFYAFRSNTPLQLVPLDETWQCSFAGNGYDPLLRSGGASLFTSQYRCNYIFGFLNLNLTLNATAYGLAYGYSQISLGNKGVPFWVPGSQTGELVLSLANSGNISGQFTVTPLGCTGSSSPSIKEGPKTHSVGASSSANFTFTVSVTVPGEGGACKFSASGFNIEGAITTVVAVASTSLMTPPEPPTLLSPGATHAPPLQTAFKQIPYLNCTFIFFGSATYDNIFLDRFLASMSAAADVYIGEVVLLSMGTVNRRRKLRSTGYIIEIQVQFPPNSMGGPAVLKELLTGDVTFAFQSDPMFYTTYGPAIITMASQGSLVTTSGTNVPSVQHSHRSFGWYLYLLVALGLFVVAYLAYRGVWHCYCQGARAAEIDNPVLLSFLKGLCRLPVHDRNKESKDMVLRGNGLFEDDDTGLAAAPFAVASANLHGDITVSSVNCQSNPDVPRSPAMLVDALSEPIHGYGPYRKNSANTASRTEVRTFSNLLALLQAQPDVNVDN